MRLVSEAHLAQVGAASPLSDTEAGVPLRLEHLHLGRDRKRGGLRSGDILDQFSSTRETVSRGRREQQLRANLPATSQINTLKRSQYMLHLFLLPSCSDEKLIKVTRCGRDIKLLTSSFKAASKILKMKLNKILFF